MNQSYVWQLFRNKIYTLILMQHQNLKTIPYRTHLFHNAFKAVPSNSPNKTVYLLLPDRSANPILFNKNTTSYICPSFSPVSDQSTTTFILLEGQCLGEYLQAKKKFLMTEDEIWKLAASMVEAFCLIANAGYGENLTHFKQYAIRRIQKDDQVHFKLLFHQSQISQLETAKSEGVRWDDLYLSPEELQGNFVPQKSIVFSFGVMLLNICSHSDRKIYREDVFQVNWEIVANKLAHARQHYRYSIPLINLIKQCLEQDHEQRYDFASLRCLVHRKLDVVYAKQSHILSKILQIQNKKGHASLNYELNFPASYTTTLGLSNRSSRVAPDLRLSDSAAKKKQKKFQTSKKKVLDPNKSQKNLRQQDIKQDATETHGHSKQSKQQSEIAESRSKDLIQQKQEEDEEEQERQQLLQNPDLIGINYRGTFGARYQSDRYQSDRQQQSNNPNVTPSQPVRQPAKVKPNISISNNHLQYEQFLKQSPTTDIDTPKGFGQFNFQQNRTIDQHEEYFHESPSRSQYETNRSPSPKRTEGSNSKINERPRQIQVRQQFGRNSLPCLESLIDRMEYLSLRDCLKGPQQLQKIIPNQHNFGFLAEGNLYYGEFVQGRRNGLGLEIFPNDQYYFGYFSDDLFDGEGFYFWNEKQYFFGKFKLGQKEWGRLSGKNLSYQGQFLNNKRHGSGICYYESGQVYKGDWLRSKRHGNGMLMSPEGGKFVGTWVNGVRKGQGYLQTEFMRIAGFWEGNTVIGEALIQYQKGDVYTGRIGSNLQKVQGQYIWKSGRQYKGSFQNDMVKKGKMIYSNGDTYYGQFKDMKRHGYGQYTYRETGQAYRGQWLNNEKVENSS